MLQSGSQLHDNFVVALLSNLFGIQAHGGCSCAGPCGHDLLNIDPNQSDAIVNDLERHDNVIKPGWTRLSFSYYMCDKTVDYIIQAVDLIGRLAVNFCHGTSSTRLAQCGLILVVLLARITNNPSHWTSVTLNSQPMPRRLRFEQSTGRRVSNKLGICLRVSIFKARQKTTRLLCQSQQTNFVGVFCQKRCGGIQMQTVAALQDLVNLHCTSSFTTKLLWL
jgi:hypothetical protein